MRVLLIAAACLAPVACSTVDREELEARLPERTAFAADAEPGAAETPNWLADFSSPELDALVAEALARNNSLAATAATFRASRAVARQVRSGLLPSLTGQITKGRSAPVPNVVNQVNDGTTGGGSTPSAGVASRDFVGSASFGVSLSWELDIWGRLTDQTRAAYLDATAASGDLHAARLSLAGRTAEAWFSLVEARQQRELAERDFDIRSRSLNITERRYDRGVSSSLDLRLARSAQASAEATLYLHQRVEQEAARALEVLLGRYPAAELQGADALPSLPGLPHVGTPADILERRPDVIAAESRMRAAGLRVHAARKALLPQITLTGTAGSSILTASTDNNQELLALDFSKIFDPDQIAASLVAGLVQPLFQGGRLRAQVQQQKQLMEQSLHLYVQSALLAFQETENALAAEKLLAAQEKALRLAFEEAAAAQDLTERRYSSGRATIFELLDAQQRRITAESQYISIVRDRLANRVSLHLAVGGAFEAPTYETDPARTAEDATPPALAAAEEGGAA